MNNTPVQLLTIHEAARYLKVSTKTLRRWDAAGVISPVRTAGGHRRYDVSDLNNLKQGKKVKRQVLPKTNWIAPKAIGSFEDPAIYPTPALPQKDIKPFNGQKYFTFYPVKFFLS